MASHKKLLFIGSIGLENEVEVFEALGHKVGARAKRYPDGETGARGYWIRWVNASLEPHPQLELTELRSVPGLQDNLQRPYYALKEGVSADDLDLGQFGYARHAMVSYAKFRDLKAEGVIPDGTRFQVCFPTPVAILSGFFESSAQEAAERAVERSFEAEVDEVVANIPNDELAIQWDVCYEIVGHDGGPPLYYDDLLGGSVERITRCLGFVPAAAEAGIHLCYGDPGHKHIVEPKDLSTSVRFANAISASAPRDVNWIHMAVPRSRSDDAYFEPLTALHLRPETELYLGLVHLTDGVDGARGRIAAAEKFRDEFGIATECGFGRRPPETISDLLDVHVGIADSS